MAELEEERRLAYVGITRAMDRLYLSYAMRRTLYGNTFCASERSRFLDEMPSVEVLGGVAPVPRPAGGRWREVSIHETAGAGIHLGLQARRPGAPSQVGRGARRRGHRGGRGRFADDQLPERRAEDGHAQVRSAREGLGGTKLESARAGRLRVAVAGALGRMGRVACNAIDSALDLELAGAFARARSANRSPPSWD